MADALLIRKSNSGTDLNFIVIGSTSQPTSPSENTIWVETETEISEFTIMPDNQIPTNPVEGMVWIVNSDASIGNFDILDVNSLWLYPTEARQYISGQWITKALQIYKDGEWIDLFPTVATIAVTYTEGFVCMCSNGEITFVAPDTSGYYVFPIPAIGTWTISCPDERFVESKDVVIDTEGQSESISVLYFPATITVTYPESTLTVTNGVRNFTHSGGGTVTFNVDQAGDWSVSVPNTENVHYIGNTTVNISVPGENKSVTITKFTATIKVTYKMGTCTCVCESTSYSHSGGGTATFTVNKAGTWTVKATYNSVSANSTVSITTTGETKSVTLTYKLDLYNAGNQCTSVTGGWVAKGDAALKTNMMDAWSSWQTSGFTTNNTLSFAGFSKICVTFGYYESTTRIKIVDSTDIHATAKATQYANAKTTTMVLGTVTSGKVQICMNSNQGFTVT